MSITSFSFFLFVFISLFLYYITPKKYSYIVLVLSSLVFLFYNSLSLINVLVVFSILAISYISGFLINKINNIKIGKIITIVSILSILIILGCLKYSSMFIDIINPIFKTNLKPITFASVLGLSYFSLIMIGYIVDVYWGISKHEKNPIKLLLFMIFYPILTSGPFIKYNDEMEDLFERKNFSFNNISLGLIRMLVGLFKVLVISSRLSIIVNHVYSNFNSLNGLVVLVAIFAYTLELYTNFSGSIDIIIGISNMYGIKLPENFDNPFLSKSITEFWRKWHITLGTWLKNYIFYPFCKSKIIQSLTDLLKKKLNPKTAKKIVLYICLLVLWTTIGIWHGGKLKFIVASGLLQYLFIVLENIFEPIMKKRINMDNRIPKIISIARVFILFSFSMVFFRASSLAEGVNIISSIFNNGSLNMIEFISLIDIIIIIISLVFMFIFEKNRELNLEKFSNTSLTKKVIIVCSLILIIIVFGLYGIGFNNDDFIYSRF